MLRGRGQRRRGGGKSSSTVGVVRKIIKNERHLVMNGKVLRVPFHPPEFTSNPWNQLTVVLETATPGITSVSLSTALRAQLGLSANQPLSIRVHSIRYWATILSQNAATSLSKASVSFRSLVPVTGTTASVSVNYPIIQEVTDFPDQVRRSCVGFEWPASQQAVVISSAASTTHTIAEVLSGAGADSIFYIRCWWRPLLTIPVNEELDLSSFVL